MSWWPTLALVLIVTVLRLVYLAFWCPYTLTEDEAHYWEWSRRPGWSYYSKGPGVAWSVAASTAILSTSEAGVRFPAPLFGAAGVLTVAWLARLAHPKAGFYAAAGALLTPAFQIGGILLTVDMPYVACWGLACVAAVRALLGGSRGAWLGLGLALGIGFLFKYTILLLVPGIVLFALLAKGSLRPAPGWRGWAAAGGLIFGVCTIPVIVWNAEHGWPTVRHLLGHAALPGGDMPVEGVRELRPFLWFAQYLGAQVALMGPVIVVIGFAVARALRERTGDDGRRLLLLCAGAPIVVGYGAVALWTRVEGNWAIAGYVPLIALGGWGVAHAYEAARGPGVERATRTAWVVTVCAGLVFGLAPLRLDWLDSFGPVRTLERGLARMGVLAEGARLVPMGRLTGAGAMVADAAELAEGLRSRTGLEPFFVAEHYGRAGLLAFYLPGRPSVYCSSSQNGEGRRTQYDYWKDTFLGDLEKLGGRPAVLIGSKQARWAAAFEVVESVGRLKNETKRNRETFLGIGYRGFGDAPGPGAVDDGLAGSAGDSGG